MRLGGMPEVELNLLRVPNMTGGFESTPSPPNPSLGT